MIVTLNDTTASAIASKLVEVHRTTGHNSALVHTLITACDSSHYEAALDAALDAAREHPARVVMAVRNKGREARLDAEIQAGEGTPGDVIVLRMSGAIADHPDAVVLPLLLSDAPAIVWWPYDAPEDMADDPLGRLAKRRISDSASAKDPCRTLRTRADHMTPGDSDLCWARVTAWRGLAAAALDQHPAFVHSARVEADPNNAPTELLTAWLALKLGVPVERVDVDGPGGITALVMSTAAGDIEIRRSNGRSAIYRIPGEPARGVALDRRSITEVMAEELRRMEPDPVLGEVMEALRQGIGQPRRNGRKSQPQAPEKSDHVGNSATDGKSGQAPRAKEKTA